ncbi:MAG: Crp/Fnr family transcriptional regulator [Gammaproteobacteria bacterium]|nr:MAG: Crp/Fnr family transcriptional regulator [Gammaproteobacteria bacterium]
MSEGSLRVVDSVQGKQHDKTIKGLLRQLVNGSPEQQAIEAGEIDAIIDYSGRNVILFPAARDALRLPAAGESTHEPVANNLLAALTQQEYQRLAPYLESVTLASGTVLHEPGEPIRFVYFPVDCLISLLPMVTGGRTVEVGLVGFDGMVGTSLALGVNVSSLRARVQIGGRAFRVSQARFTSALQDSQTLQHELNLYIYTELAASRQTALCRTLHRIEERVASRLLMTSARVRSDQFFVTQESLACVLGVRRESITQAAGALQRRRLITYSRGNLRILNRQGLEAASCHCYGRLDNLSHRA